MNNYQKALKELKTTKNKLDNKKDIYTILLINEEITRIENEKYYRIKEIKERLNTSNIIKDDDLIDYIGIKIFNMFNDILNDFELKSGDITPCQDKIITDFEEMLEEYIQENTIKELE